MEPILKPIAGSFDALGRTSGATDAHNSLWGFVTIAGQANDLGSNPTWILSVQGSPVLFASGPLFSLGPVIAGPGLVNAISLAAFGGTPNDTWLGTIWGVGAPTAEEIASISQAQSTAISVQRSSSRINITTRIVAASAAGVNPIIVADASQFQIADNVFLNRNPGPSQDTRGGFIIDAISRNADSTWSVTFLQALPVGGVNPGDNINFRPVVGVDTATPLSVTLSKDPRNGPTQFASIGTVIAASGTLVVVPGVANRIIFLWPVSIAFDTTVATGACELQDTNGVGIHQFTVGATVSNPLDADGIQFVSGLGVQIKNLMGANPAAIRGSVLYAI